MNDINEAFDNIMDLIEYTDILDLPDNETKWSQRVELPDVKHLIDQSVMTLKPMKNSSLWNLPYG